MAPAHGPHYRRMMSSSAITVILPCLNEAESLPAILAVLPNGYRALVVDNNSTDGTAALLGACRDARLQVVRQPRNIGLIGNWNACLDGAAGAHVLVLSDDDVLLPGALRRLVAPLAGPSTRCPWCGCSRRTRM